jgi:hypothetical protein
LITNKIWNLTSEIGSSRTRKLRKKNPQKNKETRKKTIFSHEVKKRGAGDYCDVVQTDKAKPITNLPGSEHMIAEFQKSWEQEYKIKTSDQLQSVIDKRNTHNEKNAKTPRDRNTTADMDEARVDGDDDEEVGYSEDDHGEDEDGSGTGGDGTDSHSKRRQVRSFYFTTGAVKRMVSKEDGRDHPLP